MYFIILAIVILMSTFVLKKDSDFTPEPIKSAQNSQAGNSTLHKTLQALGLLEQEITVYNYFFLYGPTSNNKALEGVNFPKNISETQLDESVKQLLLNGYLIEQNGNYKTSGVEFLIQKTSTDPKFKDLNQELKTWMQKAIE